ncbi:hypothetical protein ACRS85_11110 [Pluralibacter gergoviae]|uniref:hypothetical protein n=1 Tax=Pluralibacter gergoviae TaxID=61647 RepID=UPI003EE18853
MKVLLAGTALLLSGCATLVGEDEERIYIDSEPARSTFIITDDSGRIAASGTTPQSVTLKKADGSYFGGIRYTLALSSPGYSSELVPLRTRYSHWYTFGNLVFLGFRDGWRSILSPAGCIPSGSTISTCSCAPARAAPGFLPAYKRKRASIPLALVATGDALTASRARPRR